LIVNPLSISGNEPLGATFSGSSTVFLASGNFGYIRVLDSANVTLIGTYEYPYSTYLSVSPFGALSIYGTGFNYPDGELPVDTGTLTGFLSDGSPVSDPFTGGERIFLNEAAPTPEPASLTLLGIGVAVIAGFRLAVSRGRIAGGSRPPASGSHQEPSGSGG